MSSREVIASKISQKILHRLVPDVWPGTVGAIFERSLNVEMRDDFLIHIGSALLPLTPRSILFREEDFCKRLKPMCFSGQPVGIDNGFISLGREKLNLFHPQTRRYDPRLDLAGGLLPPREILNNLLAALRGFDGAREKKEEKFFSPFRGYFLCRTSMIGRIRFASLAGPGRLNGESDLSRRMKNALWQGADGFLRAMSRQDWVEARKFARGIIGLGPGLTPSGDDFLAGFISAGALWEGSSGDVGNRREAASIATAVVREEAAGRTNSVSLAMLADAANGEVAEPVKHFLRSATQTGDGREICFWGGEISRIGASSGEDMLNGIACGILFFSKEAVPA